MSFASLLSMPQAATLREGWGDPVPWSDFPQNDWADAGLGLSLSPTTRIDDRADGRCRPFYETEIDLARMRAVTRKLAAITPIRHAAFEALNRHIFGAGVTYSVAARDGLQVDQRLLDTLNAYVQDFVEANDLTNKLDLELHDRSREDGETLAWLKWGGDVSLIDIPEPDQLTEPMVSGDFMSYCGQVLGIDLDAFVPSWSFGVLTRKDACHRPLGYFFAHDSGGVDYDVVPAADVVHIKRNVPSKAKRGVSDILMAMAEDLRVEGKLATNMVTGAALQASIPWIEEQPEGTNSTQAGAYGFTDATRKQQTNIGSGGGTRGVRQQAYKAGTILRPSAGRKYVPGPMGAERNGNFELAGQAVLRRVGVRWSMPQYMISGDASNGNYSSLLVAESPFVKAREADQRFYGAALRELVWKAIGQAWRHGLLDRFGVSLRELKQLVDITAKFPEVAIRNKKETAERLEIEKRSGWVSDETAMSELGRDPAKERAQGARAEMPLSPALPPLAESTEAQRILSRVWEGYP